MPTGTWGLTQPVSVILFRPRTLAAEAETGAAGQLGTSFPWGWMGAEAWGPDGPGLDSGRTDACKPTNQASSTVEGPAWFPRSTACLLVPRTWPQWGYSAVCLAEFDQDSVSAEPAWPRASYVEAAACGPGQDLQRPPDPGAGQRARGTSARSHLPRGSPESRISFHLNTGARHDLLVHPGWHGRSA